MVILDWKKKKNKFVEKTLLVDGDNLFKIGFHGVRDFYHNGNHIGGIYHFINTLRRHLEEHNFDKVLVCWDGENNSSERRKIYPNYKLNRRYEENDFKKQSYDFQKNRVRLYLEEMFVRQIQLSNCESDDAIAYYCLISKNETKTIFSADKDYLQLVSDTISVYSPLSKTLYQVGSKVKLSEYEIPVSNVYTYKIMTGDKSDNIAGIYRLGEKKMVKFFPEILENAISVDDILTKTNELIKEDKNNLTLQNILSGKTKEGIFGDEYYEILRRIVDLKNPILSDESKEIIQQYYEESLDPDGRGYKNIIRMMTEDGMFKFLPKNDDAWVSFLKPFMKLTRKEKRKFNKN